MKTSELCQACGFEILNMAQDREITGCYMGDLLSWVMGRAKAGSIWITIMTNINVMAVAVLADVACVLIPENCEIPPETLAKAQDQEVTLLRAPLPAYECACQIARYI